MREGVPLPVRGALLAHVLPVVPAEPDRNLREAGFQRLRAGTVPAAGVGRGHPDLAGHPPVAVPLVSADLDGVAESKTRQVLARAKAKGLTLLGRVDSGEADAVLDLLGVEHRGCIAVGDADDVAFEKAGGARSARTKSRAKVTASFWALCHSPHTTYCWLSVTRSRQERRWVSDLLLEAKREPCARDERPVSVWRASRQQDDHAPRCCASTAP